MILKLIIENFIEKLVVLIELILSKKRIKWLIDLETILLSFNAKLIYVVEESNWVAKWVGKDIIENLNKFSLVKSTLGSPLFIRNKIVHYGSKNYIFHKNKIRSPHHSNKLILTWYHVIPFDEKIKFIPFINKTI